MNSDRETLEQVVRDRKPTTAARVDKLEARVNALTAALDIALSSKSVKWSAQERQSMRRLMQAARGA